MPERPTACGLPAALSEIASDAERVPLAEGVKVMLIVQLAPTVKLTPQLLVWEKSLAFAPETATPEMLKATLPVLVTVTVCAALAALTD